MLYLPMEAHNGRSIFIKHAKNIGRAYRSQATELISICLIFSRVAPQNAHEGAELRRVLRACDVALHSAADSGQKLTHKANKRFEKATRASCRYFVRWCLSAGMAIIPQKGSHLDAEDRWRPQMMIKFVLLRFPLAALHDPETVIVHQILSAKPSLSEVLWNFSRYKDRARITLEQNPHFYSSLPADENAYTPTFKHHPLGDSSMALKPHDTIYVLIDRPGRVFIESEGERRGFGNVWTLNGTLIFKDSSGVLEGEQLVRNASIKSHWWCHEEPVVFPNCECCTRLNHTLLPPIITTPSVSPTSGMPFDDWTFLTHPSPHPLNLQIYSAQSRRGSTIDLDLPPLAPTSEEPLYQALYTSINTLNDDVLLSIFKHYRPDEESNREFRLWSKLAHVCRRWRRLIYESAFHLDAHILCTEGAPVVDMLSHLAPLPLVIDYQSTNICARDELGISHALRLRNRVRRVDLHIPSSSLRKLLAIMDEPFQILEHLSLSSTGQDASLVLPKTLLAPNLRYLTLHGINFSSELSLLSSTASLVTLTLENIGESGYFLPGHLITRLRSFRQLEELSICFSIPLPNSGALFVAIETPVTLPKLKCLTFRGVTVYLENLVAQIRAPILERLSITLFGQGVFALPHLSYFTSTTEGLKLPLAKIIFEHGAVVVTDHRRLQQLGNRPSSFSLRVMCSAFDRQVDCAAQICSALRPVLSGVERLTVTDTRRWMPADPQGGDIDSATWLKLFRPFIGAKTLHICRLLRWEISRALQMGDAGLEPGLLPSLEELALDISERDIGNSFTSFIDARQVTGRPVRLLPSPVPYSRRSSRRTPSFPSDYRYVLEQSPFEHPIPYTLPSPWAFLHMLWDPRDIPPAQPAPIEHNPPALHGPPARVEHNTSRFVRTTRLVGIQPPPPKHIRSRLRPSHKGAGSVWR